VLSAAVATPLASLRALSSQTGAVLWAFSETQSTQAALDASYPYGNYTLQISCAHDGLKNLVLTLPAAAYPNPPHLTNYATAQAIDASSDFFVAWDGFSGAALNGFIQLLIADAAGNTVFATPGYGMPNALSGLATVATIPARTLAANQSYQGTLLFEALQTVDTTTYPGATGLSALSAATQFTLGTKAAGNPPALSISVSSSNVVQITASVVAQQTYRLDGSSILPGLWLPLTTNTASSSSLIFLDPIPQNRPLFFYRLVLMP
jgi:hypothetical protein